MKALFIVAAAWLSGVLCSEAIARPAGGAAFAAAIDRGEHRAVLAAARASGALPKRIERLAIVVPADGRPVLAWHEALAGRIEVAKCRNVACNGPLAAIALATPPRAGAGLAMALGANGHPVLSYRVDDDQSMRVTSCQTADCRLASHATLDDDGVHGDHSAIVVPADGRPRISYHDASRATIELARCDDAACSSASIVALDWYLAGPHSAVGVDADGRTAIAFQDEHGALLYARCEDADCSGAVSIRMVDGSAAGAGHQPSLRFAPDGLPVMSYLAGAPRRVTFARCTDPACDDALVTEIDQMGADEIGVDSPSLAIAANGLPLIAYRRTDGGLRLATCSDPGCAEGARRELAGARAGAPGTAVAVAADGSVLVAHVDPAGGVQVHRLR
jgi:hypothetical protein